MPESSFLQSPPDASETTRDLLHVRTTDIHLTHQTHHRGSTPMSLTVDIEKKLASFTLRVSFSAGDGVLALLGPSGSGKSMILRCIAGIEKPDRGQIILNGRTVFDSKKKVNLSPQERRTGYLFQNYALFPNMTVRENIEASIRKDHPGSSRERRQIAADMARRMELTEVLDRKVTELSGGQMQRTALARILVNDADIMMLDEPFSALDEHLRFTMEKELSQMISAFGKTVLLVSHNRDEVYRLADHVAVLSRGRLEDQGTVEEVFARPATVTSARLTGIKNIAPAAVDPDGFLTVPGWGIRVPPAAWQFPGGGGRLPDSQNGQNSQERQHCQNSQERQHCQNSQERQHRQNNLDSRNSPHNQHIQPSQNIQPSPEDQESSSPLAAGIRMNDIRPAALAKGPGSVITLAVDQVKNSLFSYTVELHNPQVPDPLPLYWQVSRDVWQPEGSASLDLFIPDSAVVPLRER